ncbi:MAG TPA: PAS domain S-box protein [Anaerolineales bacterium]
MPKKNRLIEEQKTPAPKRQAPASLETVVANADQTTLHDEQSPNTKIGNRKGEMDSLRAADEQHHLLEAILQATSDGILAVNRENEVLFASERFAEMWRIPPEIMASRDDTILLQHVLDQLSDPQSFLQKVQELYHSAEESFDTLYFKDGRVFDRLSRPMLEGTEVRGRVWSFRDITSRKQIENELSASEAELRTLFASMQDMVLVIDREGIYRKIAPTNPILLVRFPEDLLGKNLKDVFPTAEAEAFRRVMNQVLDKKQNAQIEYKLFIGGRIVWFQATISPLDADSTLWVAHDISHRKQMEEALRTAEANYHSIFENATEGIYQSSPQGRFLKVNPVMARIFGYDSPEDMLNSITSIEKQYYVDPTDRHKFQRLMIEQGEMHNFISWNYRKNGERIWIQESAHAVKDAQGNILYYEGFAIDITSRKQAEERLAQNHTLLRTLIDNIPDRIYVKDTQGRKIISNIADWQGSGGKTMEDVLGKSDFDTYPPELAATYWADDQSVLNLGMQITAREEPGLDSQGSPIWVMTTKVPLRDGNGKITGMVGIGRDITERKQAEEALHQSEDDLETALLELQKSLEREKMLASTDGLTGLWNRRHFFEIAPREFEAAVRYGYSLTFLMFDLDHFKQINDSLGHPAGDKLLLKIAQVAAAQVRASDIVARYGGDEFVVMLPHASVQQALPVAERIRRSTAGIDLDALSAGKEPFTLTLSIGIAEIRRKATEDNVEHVIQRADEALYRAKESGRNRTVIFGPDEL